MTRPETGPVHCTWRERFISHQCDYESIDDEIENWHSSTYDEPPLHEFLGLTWVEYAFFVQWPTLFQSAIERERAGVK